MCPFILSHIYRGEGNGNPLQCSCLENPRDGGAWWAAIYGAAQSRTQLKRLSSSSMYTGSTTSNASCLEKPLTLTWSGWRQKKAHGGPCLSSGIESSLRTSEALSPSRGPYLPLPQGTPCLVSNWVAQRPEDWSDEPQWDHRSAMVWFPAGWPERIAKAFCKSNFKPRSIE